MSWPHTTFLYNSDTPYLPPKLSLTVSRSSCARLSCFIVHMLTSPLAYVRSPTEVDTLKERMNEWLDTGPASAPVITCFLLMQVTGSSRRRLRGELMMLGPMSCFYTRSDRRSWIWEMETWPQKAHIVGMHIKMNSLNGACVLVLNL